MSLLIFPVLSASVSVLYQYFIIYFHSQEKELFIKKYVCHDRFVNELTIHVLCDELLVGFFLSKYKSSLAYCNAIRRPLWGSIRFRGQRYNTISPLTTASISTLQAPMHLLDHPCPIQNAIYNGNKRFFKL